MTVLWRCRVGSGLPRAGRLVEALLRVGLRDARGGAAGSCQRSRRQPFQPPQQIKRPIHVERSLGRGAAERRDRSLARLGSAPLTTVSPGWAAGLGAASPVQRSGPALLCPGCAGGAGQGHVAGQGEAHGRWWDWQCPTCPQGQEAASHLCRRAGLAVAVAGEGRVRRCCPPCLPCLPLPVLPALPAPAFRPRV